MASSLLVSWAEVAMRREQHGVTLIEVAVVLLVFGVLMGAAVPTVGAALEGTGRAARPPTSTRRSISRRPARALRA
jgi:prepilin-type N-terminal cleavage/methylation domain-containing protein